MANEGSSCETERFSEAEIEAVGAEAPQKKTESGVRPKARRDDIGHVSLEEMSRRALEAAELHELGWDEDEPVTGVDSPVGRKNIQTVQNETKHLSAIGLRRVSFADYNIWQEILGGNLSNASRATQLSPEVAVALVSHFYGEKLILTCLRNLPTEVARILAMSDVRELQLPGVEIAEPGGFEYLLESKIQHVRIGENRLK